jgi:acyl dehydratase
MQMKKFEDLEIGQCAMSAPLTVDREDMLAFSRKYDPQWFHSDPEAARQSVFKEVIASGVYTAALWRKLDHQINGDVDFICGVAWEDVRWPKAVRAGDSLHATSEIVEKRDSASDPARGIATFRYELLNQHDEVVFTCLSINLVRRRSAAQPAMVE